EAYTNIAGPIAQSDPERGLRLRGLVQEQKYLDAITGSVAYGYFKQGEMLKAQHTAQEIQDDQTRVKMMRKIAEEQSLLLDKYNILRKAEENIPEAVDVSTISPGPSFGTLKIFELEAGKLETGAPVPPNLYVTADSVRADLAPIKPGRAEIALMRNSYYNEKFISAIPGQTLLRKKQGRNSLEFIMIESGTYDLPSLQAHLNAQGYFSKAIVNEGRIFTLRLPLLVMPGAKLVISGADVESLRLSDDRGAFIVNAGTVQIADTIVEAWEEENNQRAYRYYTAKKQFRPFITTWTGGDIDVVGSTIFGLGYLGGKSYGLSMSAGPASITKTRPMFEDAPTGRLIDNSFRNMFYAYYAYEATDAKIVGNELVDNIVYGLDPHDRAQRLLMGLNTAYDTHKKHGLIISREVDYSWFIGNITYENAGSGIMLDRDSTNTLIYANTSFHNEQDGISFFESSCNIVAANEFYNNKRDGIKVRNSWNVGVFDNKISGNGAFGVDTYAAWLDPDGAHVTRDFDLDPYFTFAGVEIVNNDFGDNRSAIKFEGVNGSMIGPNDMSDQSPRLFAGDLASIGGTILTALREKRIPAVANQCAQALPPVDCPYLTAGYLRGEGQGLLPPLDDTGRCIPSSAQAQINAADLVVEDGQDDEPEETVTQ
ncbi:MAG TPA: right-handed parallel beta-helix repeat-containing protein, partial [Paracoccaceae bacterium]|nr:right-handed parallel beta-helix repeat-containing protein [Paracoccaceae bacterium]